MATANKLSGYTDLLLLLKDSPANVKKEVIEKLFVDLPLSDEDKQKLQILNQLTALPKNFLESLPTTVDNIEIEGKTYYIYEKNMPQIVEAVYQSDKIGLYVEKLMIFVYNDNRKSFIKKYLFDFQRIINAIKANDLVKMRKYFELYHSYVHFYADMSMNDHGYMTLYTYIAVWGSTECFKLATEVLHTNINYNYVVGDKYFSSEDYEYIQNLHKGIYDTVSIVKLIALGDKTGMMLIVLSLNYRVDDIITSLSTINNVKIVSDEMLKILYSNKSKLQLEKIAVSPHKVKQIYQKAIQESVKLKQEETSQFLKKTRSEQAKLLNESSDYIQKLNLTSQQVDIIFSYDTDIDLILSKVLGFRDEASKAYDKHDGNIVNAIMEMTK